MIKHPISTADIVRVVLAEYGVTDAEFYGELRDPRFVQSREACAWLAQVLTTQSFPEVAREMRRPTHTSVISMWKRARSKFCTDTAVRKRYLSMAHRLHDGQCF